MFLLFPFLLAWVISTIGWGAGVRWLLNKLGIRNPYPYDPLEPVIGLVFLTLLTELLNFVAPIYADWALWIMLLGWVLFLRTARRFAWLVSQPLWGVAGLIWLACISTVPILNFWNGDTGFYHIPTMHWIAEERLPVGLANLNGRFGFNSPWFVISTLMAQVVAPYTATYSAIASETLLALFGLASLHALRGWLTEGRRDVANLFLLLSSLVCFAPIIANNLSSPATDHPPLVLSLLLVYVLLRAVTNHYSEFLYNFWLACLLTFYIVTLKASLLPLLLLLPLVVFIAWRAGVNRNLRVLLPRVLAAGVLVLIPWLVRGVFTSGCLLYPVSATCLRIFSWTVTKAQADNEALWIESWARNPWHPPQEVLANWDWLVPWSQRFFSSYDFIFPIVCFASGIVLIVLRARTPRTLPERWTIVAILGVMVVGGIYWFVTAPDLRFGVTWFWVSGILVLTAGIWSLVTLPRLVRVVEFGLIVVWAFSALAVGDIGMSWIRRAGWKYESLYLAVPQFHPPTFVAKKTTQGVTVYTPTPPSAACWWQTLPCTPYFNPGITMRRGTDYRLFIYPSK